jgi:predicted nucleic acid-binding protein
MPLVVDASAALKLIVDEPGSDEVRQHLREVIRARHALMVPALFWLELVNVLALRHRFAPSAIVEAVYELEKHGLATADVGRPGVLALIDAVARTGLTAYDAAYLTLAESADARLLTADARLAAAAGDRAILVGGRGVAEPAPTYRAAGSWATWRGAAGYLAELRSSVAQPSDHP